MLSAQRARLITIDEARRGLEAEPTRATIRGRTWNGISIDKSSSYVTSHLVGEPRDHHLLTINLGDMAYVRSQRCGGLYEGPGFFGESSVQPAATESIWDGNIPPHITIRFHQDVVVELGKEICRDGHQKAGVVNHFRMCDPFFEAIGRLFNLELERAPHPAQDVLVESLATAVLLHLLRGYSDLPRQEEQPVKYVAPASLRRALAYIEDQPNARISLGDLAGAAGLSRFHFSRLFRKHIGINPAAYIERSRLERAKAMIRLGQMSLTDIAYAVGFADQSHFTRRFRRLVGCTPSQYAREHSA